MALIVTTFLMFAICLSASAKGKKNVERGMTKQEVIAILGQPKLTSFDAYGDRWDYSKTNVLTGENKQITVGFDLNGRVVAYNTRFVDDNTSNGTFNNRNDMATQLGISANTVEFHRRRIMQKLNVANAAEMIRRATELGWKTNI